MFKDVNIGKLDESHLATYAVKSSESLGREHPEELSRYKSPFQIDRERIIQSRSFRRLISKTQVLVTTIGDGHVRNRLTHSLEVAQMARAMARNLKCNEDLAEAIALAHDLGHTPYGHAGEEALDEALSEYGYSFEHNIQSRRVVTDIEKLFPNTPGLNLTIEVIEGLMKHQTAANNDQVSFQRYPHLEAQITDYSDQIAYSVHDLDDAIRLKVVSLEDVAKLGLWQRAYRILKEKYPNLGLKDLRRLSLNTMSELLVVDLTEGTLAKIDNFGIKTKEDIRNLNQRLVNFSDSVYDDLREARDFIMKRFVRNEEIYQHVVFGKKVIKTVFGFFMGNPDKLPSKLRKQITDQRSHAFTVRDYVAGMTDKFVYDLYKKITGE